MPKINGKDIIAIMKKAHLARFQKKIVAPNTVGQIIRPDDGYDGLSEVEIGSSTLTAKKTVTPKATAQTINPDSGDIGLLGVVVKGDTNLVAGNIKKNVSIFGVTGSLEGGMATLKQFISREIVEVTEDDFGSVTTTNNYLFQNCVKLVKVKFPNTVTKIGDGTFSGCTQLSEVTLPEGLTGRFPTRLFEKCTSLKNVIIPSGITYMYYGCFSGCSSLEEMSLPENLTAITQSTFQNCTNLKSVNIPPKVTTIESLAFSNCESLQSIIIPNGVTTIQSNAFAGCSGLTSITIPNSVTSFGNMNNSNNIFYNCTGLKSVVFEEGSTLTELPWSTFECCSGLTNITLPASITKLGQKALALSQPNVPTNATVTMLSTTPPILCDAYNQPATSYDDALTFGMKYVWNSNNTSYKIYPSISKIIVPKGCGDVYKAADVWSSIADYIVEATE